MLCLYLTIDKEGNQLTTGLPNPKDLGFVITKIALFHGGVDKHFYDNGFQVEDDRVKVDTFQGMIWWCWVIYIKDNS